MQKIPRLLIISGVTIIAFALIIAIVFLARLASTGNRVNTEIASLRVKGDPTKLSDLAHPPIADDKNAAVVFNEIFKKYPKLDCQIKSKSKADPSKFMQEARIEFAKYPRLDSYGRKSFGSA